MDDHNVVKVVKATCILHNYLHTAQMDAANVMGQLNPQGAAYMQPHAMLRELRTKAIMVPGLLKEFETSTWNTLILM